MQTAPLRLSTLFLTTAGLALGLASCVSTEREAKSSSPDPRATYTPPPVGSRARIGAKTVLNTVNKLHSFSNPTTQDNFVLQLRGPRILTAQAHLFVISSTGDTLGHEVLPARALLSQPDLTDAPSASVRDQEIAILQGMNNFFADGHFIQPAVPAGAVQPAEVDTKTWAALREDPATVAFDYVSTGGSEQRMAYVRKLHKSVIITQ